MLIFLEHNRKKNVRVLVLKIAINFTVAPGEILKWFSDLVIQPLRGTGTKMSVNFCLNFTLVAS